MEFQNLSTYNEFKTVGVSNIKKQIILTDSKRGYKNYINSLIYRYNKKNLYLPHYLITKDGEVFQFIEPESYTNYMDNEDVNRFGIIISLENYNWLKKNPLEDTYVNWIGDIYNQKVFERKWRDYFFWQPYIEEQLELTAKLCVEITKETSIPLRSVEHNTKINGVEKIEGIVTRSNFDSDFTDVSPAFNFEYFIKQLYNE